MDAETPTPDATPTTRRRNIMASLKGLLFTMMVLAALWFALRHVLTPLVLPEGSVQLSTPASHAEERIKALEDKMAALENKAMPAPDFSPLEARIAALENAPKAAANDTAPAAKHEEIEALRSELEKLKATDHATVKSLILIAQLQDAVRAGRPFASELTALVVLHPAWKEQLTPLMAASATGIATLDGLKEQFARAIAPALAPESNEKSLTQNLRSLVKIRKIGESQQGKDDESVIARAEGKLAKGDVAGTLQETKTLSPAAAKNFTAWQERAETYLSAQAVLAALHTMQAGASE